MRSLFVVVDEVEKDEFEHEEQEDLGCSNDSKDNKGLFLKRLEVVHNVQDEEGNGINHAVDHE